MTPGNAARKLRFHTVLGCVPLELHYDFLTATGRLVIADGNQADMAAAVALFEGIDPRAVQIWVFSGINADTAYARHGERWEEAKRSRRTAPLFRRDLILRPESGTN